jgi:hypothetical protein
MFECIFGVSTHGQLGKKPYPVLESTYRIGIGLGTSLIPIHAISYLCTLIPPGKLIVFKISHQAEVVTYPRKNVTIVCGVSQHIF